MKRLDALFLLAFAGCASQVDQITAYGFEHGSHSLRVAFAEGRTFAGEGWRVDNLQSMRDGPARYKRGNRYMEVVRFDSNNDGTENGRVELPRYLLRLTHDRTPGLIWLSHLAVSRRFENTNLDALARMYVESVAGAGLVVSSLSTIEETRYATRILSETSIAVDGFEGLRVVFEIADVDQLQLSQDARWKRAEVVLIRSGFLIAPEGARRARRQTLLPTLLVAGHENLSENFDETSGAFTRFISTIDFRRAELSAARSLVEQCAPEADWVRVYHGLDTGVRVVDSPELELEGVQCLLDDWPDGVEVGFTYRRDAYRPPDPVGAIEPDADRNDSFPADPDHEAEVTDDVEDEQISAEPVDGASPADSSDDSEDSPANAADP
ncbi:MAG: hypothetical protein AAF938_15835 [Myxococcota bacterium]